MPEREEEYNILLSAPTLLIDEYQPEGTGNYDSFVLKEEFCL